MSLAATFGMLSLGTRHSLVSLTGLLITGVALAGCHDGLGLPCANPAPFYNAVSPAPGYFVALVPDLDLRRTTAALERRYHFNATSVLPGGGSPMPNGFTAEFSDQVRERLRCDAAVLSITQNQNPTSPPPPQQ